MLVLKRGLGESVEIVQYELAVKVETMGNSTRGRFVRLSKNGVLTDDLRKGEKIKIGEVTLCVTGFHRSKVTIGFDAPKDIEILRSELLRGAA